MSFRKLNIDWAVFTLEEKQRIVALRSIGDYKHLTNVVDTMTPQKEIQIQKMIDYLKPLNEGFKSDVKKEYDKKFPKGPQTPQEEAEMQEALNKEWSDFINKKQKQQVERLKSLGEISEEAEEAIAEEPEAEKPKAEEPKVEEPKADEPEEEETKEEEAEEVEGINEEAEEAGDLTETAFDDMTVKQLKDYADENKIDIAGLTKKSDILNAILKDEE
jgi:hypothetical protein